MKNYKDMADAVFRRRDEYAADLKRKKKIAVNVSLSLCTICLAVLGAFGIWKTGILEPDPNVIGTKPHSVTEPVDVPIHSLSSNATSEGEHTEITQTVSGNPTIKPTEPDSSSVNSQGNPKETDPIEKPTLPQLPDLPNLPNLPSLPTVPNIPVVPTLPSRPVPPTVTPDDPVETDPVDIPDATCATDGAVHDKPATNDPPQPSTQAPTWKPGHSPDVPPTSGDSGNNSVRPEKPTDPTDPMDEPTEPMLDPKPPTEPPRPESETVSITGKVVDQYGNPVEGALVALYYNETNYVLNETNSQGYFEYICEPYEAGIYIKMYSAPEGYTKTSSTAYLSGPSGYFVFACTKS